MKRVSSKGYVKALALAVMVIMAALHSLASAQAMERFAFSADAFAAAQRENRAILLEVHAWWCPVCWMQKTALAELEKEARFKDIVSFTLDYDKDKSLLRQFNVQKQSTLIVYKGAREAGRVVGESDTSSLRKLLALLR